MSILSIRRKMLGTILPIIVVAMVLTTIISSNTSNRLITAQFNQRMDAELSSQEGIMNEYLHSVSNMSAAIARLTESSYKVTKMEDYEKILENIISDNEIVLGSGLWFEPYAYDPESEYMGPYVYKDGGDIVVTYDYSNADYDYFNQEYYTMTKDITGPKFTDPYYDDVSGLVMSTCATPIIVNGKFLGCVTVDIELSAITGIIDNLKVGQTGTAMLLTEGGTYLAGVDTAKVANNENITNEANSSLAALGNLVVSSDNGSSTYQDGKITYDAFYRTLAATGWKLIIQMNQDEMKAPIKKLATTLAVVAAFALLFTIAVVLALVLSITKVIHDVRAFSTSLSQGDFSIEPLNVKSKDELGLMSNALNTMFSNNKSVIATISDQAKEVDASAVTLNDGVAVLNEKFEDIQKYMNDVNESMLTTSAATQEVNASVEEVLANANMLAGETDETHNMAIEIRSRAKDVGDNSRKAYDSATELAAKFEKELQVSMENAKVVNNIEILASAISEIAEQINLLSLNASIEAARAGEAGRGFAIVASEIGKLAENTSQSVQQIQATTGDVQAAFAQLSNQATLLIDFLKETVAPDYANFVDVAKQYGADAAAIDSSSDKLAVMADTIKNIMSEVAQAVQSIAEATENTTELSSDILQAVEDVSGNVDDISELAKKQNDVSDSLNEVVGKFKI